ncbi:hypothetical protein PTSG_00905 [Salpingoeca rosetta]|uniref:RRM domain-containing protein n=1 Tax=Salpingoeca rosetta (strain ATCC 50818 / BSB-021) TaxID=946362 RepID=F2TXU0_SALR5|nr:uncharacterized protein PTSG_00905 [Salpingoeca rosetta]EGD76199.1 hypothetical protein PTSG_00905 [Salpingoeca rosetta]|eukprot:XP_004998374.1 hypothetical protein PTSG_00905 [Salpingoeca rosetta]
MSATRLWVGGIAEDVTVLDLYNLFAPHGKIDSIVIRPNYAFVDIECQGNVDDVVQQFHEYDLHGSVLTVEEAKSSQNTAITSPVSVFVVGIASDADLDTLREQVAGCTSHEIKESKMHGAASAHEGDEPAPPAAEFVFENEDAAREAAAAIEAADLPGPEPKCFTGIRFGDTRRARKPRPDMALPFPVQLVVRPSLVGAIIGRGGANIRQLSQVSRARVELERRDPHLGAVGRRVFIDGSLNNTVEAFRALVQLMADNDVELNGEEPVEAEDRITSIQMMIPGEMVGHLIGRAGASIKYITETSGAGIELLPLQYPANMSPVRIVKIEGTPRQLTHAFALMLRKFSNAMRRSMEVMRGPPMMGMMQQQQQQMPGMAPPYVPGYGPGPMMMAPVEVITVRVPAWSVGALIGRGGSNIKHMMEETGAEIRIQNSGDDVEEPLERDCVVRGTTEQQVRAHALIFRRMQDEQARLNIPPTDPRSNDLFPVVMEVPAAKVGRVIGRGGATIRDIQQKTGVGVEVQQNEENPEANAAVMLHGSYRSVQAALNILRPQQQQQSQYGDESGGVCTCCSDGAKTALLAVAMVLVGVAFGLAFYAFYERVVVTETVALAALAASGGVFGILALLLAVHISGVHRRARRQAYLRNSAYTRHLFANTTENQAFDPRDAGNGGGGGAVDDLEQEERAVAHDQAGPSTVGAYPGHTHPPARYQGQEHAAHQAQGAGAEQALTGRGDHVERDTIDDDGNSGMSEAQLYQEVQRVAHQLEAASAQGDDDAVARMLRQLNRRLVVTETLLASTGIGRVVNGIQGACRPQAQALIAKWRSAVTGSSEYSQAEMSSSGRLDRRAGTGRHAPVDDAASGGDTQDESAVVASLTRLNARLVGYGEQGDVAKAQALLNKLEAGQDDLTLERLRDSGLYATLTQLKRGDIGARAQRILQHVRDSQHSSQA